MFGVWVFGLETYRELLDGIQGGLEKTAIIRKVRKAVLVRCGPDKQNDRKNSEQIINKLELETYLNLVLKLELKS